MEGAKREKYAGVRRTGGSGGGGGVERVRESTSSPVGL